MERAVAACRPRRHRALLPAAGQCVGADSLAPGLTGDAPVRLDRFADGGGPVRSYIAAGDLLRVFIKAGRPAPRKLPPVLNVAAPCPGRHGGAGAAAGPRHRLAPRTGARPYRKSRLTPAARQLASWHRASVLHRSLFPTGKHSGGDAHDPGETRHGYRPRGLSGAWSWPVPADRAVDPIVGRSARPLPVRADEDARHVLLPVEIPHHADRNRRHRRLRRVQGGTHHPHRGSCCGAPVWTNCRNFSIF